MLQARKTRVLLSEDDSEMRAYLAVALRSDGYDVTTCADGARLIEYLGATRASGEGGFALVVSDIRMPGLSGLQVLERLQEWQSFPSVILITAFGDEKTHARARELGAKAVIDKPFDTDAFLAVVHAVVDAGQ